MILPILPEVSIDAFESAGEGTRLGLSLADPNAQDPVRQIHEAEVRRAVDQALLALDIRERHIIRCRFGFFDEEKRTLEEIGRVLHLSRERIRQIEFEAKKKLRTMLAGHRARLT